MTGLPEGARVAGRGSIVIRAHHGWGRLDLGDLWRYRELVWFLVWRNIKGKYRQMALGPLWIIIQPIINTILFTFVFGRLAGLASGGDYAVVVYSAMVPWVYFAGALRATAGSLVEQMQVVSKVYFPRLVVPLAAALAGIVDLLISFGILVVMAVYFGHTPNWRYPYLLVCVLLAVGCALAIGLWTATLAVKYRDVRFAINNAVQIGMYLSPVAYPASVVSERLPEWMWLYRLNPMYWVVEGFRWAILGTGAGPETYMLVPAGAVLVLLVSGAFVFRRTERTIVDLL